MADIQLFHNDPTGTTLAVALASGATSATVADGSAMASPAAGQYERLTITDGTNIEIVTLTARSGNVLTIAREQEGTTSPASFSIGAVVQARVTAETLAGMGQGLDNGGNARGARATNLQSGRSADANVASGSDSTAVGYDSKSSGAYAAALGGNAVASGQGSVASGWGAVASDTDSLAIGAGALASAATSVAVGDATASHEDAVAIGNDATTSSQAGVAVGKSASATGSGWSTAAGFLAAASGVRATALGAFSRARVDDSVGIAGLGIISRDGWSNPFNGNTAFSGVVVGRPVSLSGGKTWAASTLYYHGDVVHPTTPNGYQYELYTSAGASITSGESEPTWTTYEDDGVAANAGATGYWVRVDPANQIYYLPSGARFVVEDVGLYVEYADTVTVDAVVNFGIDGTVDNLVNAETAAGLTAANNHHRCTTTDRGTMATTTIHFGIETNATATQLVVRPYWRGFLVEAAHA